MKFNWIQLAILAALLIGLLLFFSPRIVNFFIFYPQVHFDSLPSNWGLHYEEIFFQAEDNIKLHGWYFPAKREMPLILFCHGNAGNISHCLPVIEQMNERGLPVFIFDYRGYGKSEGSPTEKGIYMDGLAAYDFVLKYKDLQPEKIVPFGHSLGAAVAVEIALNRKIRAVILESAFTSMKDMAKTILIFRPLAHLSGPAYNNLEKVRRIAKPMLIIHGDRDEIVPFKMGEALFKGSKQPKYFLPVKGAGHNDIHLVGGNRYADIIAAFAKEVKSPQDFPSFNVKTGH